MALITLPAKFGFTRIDTWGLLRAGRTLRSRFTGSRQTIVLPYALWTFSGTLIEYPEPEASAIRAFLLDLDGQANTFNLPVPGWSASNANVAVANYTLNGAIVKNAAQAAIIATGYNGAIPLIGVGDYFMIGTELKMVTTYTPGAAGQATIKFKPPMRAAAVNGAAVVVRNPYCTMAASNDDVGTWGLAPPVRHSFELKAYESF